MRSLILQVVALLFLADAFAQLPGDAPGSEVLSTILTGVPDTRQSTEYSCGAAMWVRKT
jgi:hypothetical protein